MGANLIFLASDSVGVNWRHFGDTMWRSFRGRAERDYSQRGVPFDHTLARTSASQLPALFRRATRLAHRDVDAVGSAIVAGLPADRLGGAARRVRIREPNPHLSFCARGWPCGGLFQQAQEPGLDAKLRRGPGHPAA